PPPPDPTHFPYTTLFRSELRQLADAERALDVGEPVVVAQLHDLVHPRRLLAALPVIGGDAMVAERAHPRRELGARRRHRPAFSRSEEHTSELQSQSNLVC